MIDIAILLSGKHGRGSNMEAIARACAAGTIDGRVTVVAGNFAQSPALARARELGLRTVVVPSPGKGGDEGAYAVALLAALNAEQVDLVCLAGYMRKVPGRVVRAFAGRMMNTHPALLPAFGGQGMYGLNVHQAAIDAGVKVSGCTVHFVDEHYDTGPIVLQMAVPVEEGDTAESLQRRVLACEHRAYPEAAALFAQGRLSVDGRRVQVRPEG